MIVLSLAVGIVGLYIEPLMEFFNQHGLLIILVSVVAGVVALPVILSARVRVRGARRIPGVGAFLASLLVLVPVYAGFVGFGVYAPSKFNPMVHHLERATIDPWLLPLSLVMPIMLVVVAWFSQRWRIRRRRG